MRSRRVSGGGGQAGTKAKCLTPAEPLVQDTQTLVAGILWPARSVVSLMSSASPGLPLKTSSLWVGSLHPGGHTDCFPSKDSKRVGRCGAMEGEP